MVFCVPKTADEKLLHLVHCQKVDNGIETGIQRHTVYLLKVAEEVKPVPVHELLVHQHHDSGEAGR